MTLIIAIDCGDYWQCAYLVPKGGFDSLKAAGLRPDAARDGPADRLGFLPEHVRSPG